MASAMIHFLPQAPHQLWQTAASPFIIPMSWQSMYQRCPRCGGSAPNVCDDVWPEKWWEDDMLGLMYQGHIPPTQRVSPWESYYSSFRVNYSPPSTPQAPLRINTKHYQAPQPHVAPHAPMTPPTTPGVARYIPHYHMQRPETPTSPMLQYSRQGTWRSVSSFDSTNSVPAQISDPSMSHFYTKLMF
jgi:hypothetical protein